MSTQAEAASAAASGNNKVIELLARPPNVVKVNLDVAYFDPNPAPAPDPAAPELHRSRPMLSERYVWLPEGATTPRIPLQFCEFLAYKTALAYEPEPRIRDYLAKCCEGIGNFAFFDSGRNKGEADSQAYGFVFENKAFVVFRGTENDNDWAINRSDAMTDKLGDRTDKRVRKLERRYGDLLRGLGDPKPGRHVGFAIAWASIRDEVEKWFDSLAVDGRSYPIVLSGHSLGGALALVAGFDLARKRSPESVLAVVTFGAPLVGNDEFAAAYQTLLGDRTVRLESSGDIVPVIMRRWYYRRLYFLRQWLEAGLRPKQDAAKFASVGQAWSFSEEPPLSSADLNNALQQIRTAMDKAAKDLENIKKNADEKPATGKGGVGGQDKPAAKPSSTSKPSGEPAPTTDGKGEQSTVIFWVLGGVVVVTIALVAWLFVRRKLFSHDIQQRYALYLSTLSYQQLRRKHNGDLTLANSELDRHLLFIRGDAALGEKLTGKPYYEVVRALPLRLELKDDEAFVRFLGDKTTFV